MKIILRGELLIASVPGSGGCGECEIAGSWGTNAQLGDLKFKLNSGQVQAGNQEMPRGNCEFFGTFDIPVVKNGRDGSLKKKRVSESVKVKFVPERGHEGDMKVTGKGANEYGKFRLFGMAIKGRRGTYSVTIHKKYIAARK